MTDVPGPRQISTVILELEITGYVTPFAAGRPLLIGMPGTNDSHIAVFSTLDKLHAFFAAYPEVGPYDTIKVIMDGPEFVASILDAGLPWLRIIADPYKHESGKARYSELIPRGN